MTNPETLELARLLQGSSTIAKALLEADEALVAKTADVAEARKFGTFMSVMATLTLATIVFHWFNR